MRQFGFDIRYFFRPPWDTGISPPELIVYIASNPPGAVIELGCGTGTNAITLARSGWQVTGVDFSAIAIRRARRRLRQASCCATLVKADVTRPLPLQASYDLALDIGCFHAIAEHAAYLQNLARLLKTGGQWLMYGFTRAPGIGGGVGLNPSDMGAVAAWGFRLLNRHDGLHHGKPSAWFLLERTSMDQLASAPALASS